MKIKLISSIILATLILNSCKPPAPPQKGKLSEKHNYIVLLDLSDRLIVQEDQPSRDIEIVKFIFNQFENKVKRELYIKSRDEIKVVIAPQKGSSLRTDIYEDKMYINIDNIKKVFRKAKEEERRTTFNSAVDELYKKAVFSEKPDDYHGADIWKYFYEDLKDDYSNDTLTKNFLFIITDGYPIVGKNTEKLAEVKQTYPDLHVALVEATPRDKDMEWDRIMQMWTDWFDQMEIQDYKFIKRKAISKELDQIKEMLEM